MSGVQFTTLIRLPFARGDFADPQQATWDATKDRTLWKIISKSSKTSDLNWTELADNFHVPQTFLLQQAAWLYERHLDHVRAQMKKVASSNTPATFGLENTHTTVGGVAMKRVGSGGSGAYRPSVLPARQKDNTMQQGEPVILAPPLSRTPSTNTITQARAYIQPSSRNQPPRQRQNPASDRVDQTVAALPLSEDTRSSRGAASPVPPTSSSDSSSPSNSDSENSTRRSQLFKRPPRFRTQRPRELITSDEVIDEGEENGLGTDTALPFAKVPRPSENHSNTKMTSRPSDLRHDGSTRAFREPNYIGNVSAPGSSPSRVEANSSVTSSASDAPKPELMSLGPQSPKHRTDLAKLSPRNVAMKARREGSEGTPSMGSSFSDLDDASISQSALEEALLSNIQHGRMSTLSQLRSKYL
ncbi:hypothetical protein K458DRAFT_411244 [Lentithecium fluviatile CBS 122367]|uniref:Autophagy-related protein 29 n=1 Tax=Lentithecium fluviatile CBS 122367 TaxID=1168545 RepID=A0A6G1JMR8_9PLEO|nr:hypothetical protein K458DRAFT_411244 [Lentithecium fluviatile CBS 122367]